MNNSALLFAVSIGVALLYSLLLFANKMGVVGDWVTGTVAIYSACVGFLAPLALSAVEKILNL